MWFALTYVLVAGTGAGLASLVLKRNTTRLQVGLNYLRAGLFCSATLMACQVLLYLFTESWQMSPWFVIVLGFGLPILMTAIT